MFSHFLGTGEDTQIGFSFLSKRFRSLNFKAKQDFFPNIYSSKNLSSSLDPCRETIF